MIGAIIGDILGSIYEFHNYRKKDFKFFTDDMFVTDDSIMTLAVAKALKTGDLNDMDKLSSHTVNCMQQVGRPYKRCGYGGRFYEWMYTDNPQPYGSFGNGSAMRVSPVGFIARDIEEAKKLSNAVTRISHNHPEGIKGAEATAVAIVLARLGKSKEEIKKYIHKNYYDLHFTIDAIRPFYRFSESCQGTVPVALEAFFESTSFEDAMRIAISVGGDSDTLAAITGGVAEAFYGVPKEMEQKALTYLDERQLAVYNLCKDLNNVV